MTAERISIEDTFYTTVTVSNKMPEHSHGSSFVSAPAALSIESMPQYITSSMSFTSELHDYVFRGAESVLLKTAKKRIEKFRQKHPESTECLDRMKKLAYQE